MTDTSTVAPHRTATSLVSWVLRGTVAVALVIDAVVHLRLAAGYQQSASGGIGAGNVFRIEAAAAVVVAAWVLWRGHRPALLAAFAVGLSAVVAVVLYRYVDVPGFGPLPAMYEPVWFPEKTLSAVAEGVATLAALAALAVVAHGRHDSARWGGASDEN